MLVSAVAGVDHGNIGIVGHRLNRAVPIMTHHQHVSVTGNDPSSVGNRFTLGGGRRFHIRTADNRATQALHGRLEGKTRSGTGLVKKGSHNPPIGHLVTPELVRVIGQIEDLLDLVITQIGNRYQVASRHVCDHLVCQGTKATWSIPSDSSSITLILSPSPASTFLPTISARMGSSRAPRSIRTATRIRFGCPSRPTASIAARIVRPRKITSSTSTTVLSSTETGTSKGTVATRLWSCARSSRYWLMSMTPTEGFILVIASIFRAMRRARCTPRDRMPISTNSVGFVVFSTTSWAMRLKVLPSSSCSNRIRFSWLMAKKKTPSEFREGPVE